MTRQLFVRQPMTLVLMAGLVTTFLVSLLPLTLLGAVLNHRAGRKAP